MNNRFKLLISLLIMPFVCFACCADRVRYQEENRFALAFVTFDTDHWVIKISDRRDGGFFTYHLKKEEDPFKESEFDILDFIIWHKPSEWDYHTS